MPGENRVIVAVIVATIVTTVAGFGSAWWMDAVVAETLRGSGYDLLMLPGIIGMIVGAGACWYWVYNGVYRMLGSP